MRAAILDRGRVQVGEFPDPTPIKGQVLVRTRRCALCASDAHFLASGATIVERSKRNNGPYGLGDGIGLSGVEEALMRMSDPAEPIRRVVDPSRE